MKLNLAVVTIWAEDIQKTVHFYKEVLGFSHHHQIADGVFHFLVNGVYLTIMQGTPGKATNSVNPRFPVIAFSVDDLERAMIELKNHKVDLPWGVEQSHAAKWIMFYDPAGNLIELVEFQKDNIH